MKGALILEGKKALITGAARGIGREIALTLAGAGASVALIDLLEDPVLETAKEASSMGVKGMGIAADVTKGDEVDAAVKRAVGELGGLDILVNNAGITRDNLLMRMTDDEWDSVLAVNLKAAFLMTRASVRPMMKGRWGRIVNIASVIGLMGNPGQANYAASKAGLIGLTKTTAREFASRGITANAVAPGFIKTAMTDKLTEEVKAALLERIPSKRLGEVSDVANAVRFLASEEAGYITGQVLTVDGGLVM